MSNEANSSEKLKNIKDCNSIDELDFDNLNLTRGETPPDIKERCLQLCKDYLSGNWTKQTMDTIEVRRISGGLTNQLYYCGISDTSTEEDVPQEVAVRLYGPKHMNTPENGENERLTDVIIGLKVSDNKLGPKIYGVFEGGQIQAYYEHRQFKKEEQNNKILVKEVFEKLAKIHAMDVPIKRDNNWYFNEIDKSFDIICKQKLIDELVNEFGFEIFKTHDMKTEINWIKEMIAKTNSPFVFCHNDYRSSNLMITQKQDTNNNEEEIVVCDFEYSCYGRRGGDFMALFSEWGRNQFEVKSVEGFPPQDSVMKALIQIYIDESKRIFGDKYSENAINSLDHILKEIKVFMLSMLLFWNVLIVAKANEENNDFVFTRKVSMELAEIQYKNYFVVKQRLKDENLFQHLDEL